MIMKTENFGMKSPEFAAKLLTGLAMAVLCFVMIMTFTKTYGSPNFWMYILFCCALSVCERIVGPLLFYVFKCPGKYERLQWSDFKIRR